MMMVRLPSKTLTPQFSTELSGEEDSGPHFSEEVQEITKAEPSLHVETFCNQLALNKIPEMAIEIDFK